MVMRCCGALFVSGAAERSRVPFETAFIQDKLLATGALDGVNEDARHVLYVVADCCVRGYAVVSERGAVVGCCPCLSGRP
jgi:hypothetical protein